MFARFKAYLSAAAALNGRRSFVFSLKRNAKLLDVGCGNNSPFKVKTQRPDIYYLGIDVADYNQTKPLLADEYFVVSPDEFVSKIEDLHDSVDAVVSSHNIEHCVEPRRVIRGMANALKPGGVIYISFPSEASAGFPPRDGCLNFHDDPTHRDLPVFDEILETLRQCGCEATFQVRNYHPLPLRLLGAVLEPISRLRGRVMLGTWAYYGFESIIWARKKAS